MKISFCTTCAQRLYQLEQVWDSNILNIKNHPNVEWVLLNYDGCEKMHSFLMSKRNDWPKNFVYAKELSNREWHVSIAKNIAHQLGNGEILFNLDCDNFISNAIDVINENFVGETKLMHLFSGIPKDGTFGRIAVDRNIFYNIGGYDESFYPMSGQDSDIVARVNGLKYLTKIYHSSSDCAIKNTKVDSIKLCQKFNMTWEQFAVENRKLINSKLKNKQFIANQKNGMTKPNVEIFRGVVA